MPYAVKAVRVERVAEDGKVIAFDRVGANFNFTIRPKSPCGYYDHGGGFCEHPVKYQLLPVRHNPDNPIIHANDCGCHAETAILDIDGMRRGESPVYYKWHRWNQH